MRGIQHIITGTAITLTAYGVLCTDFVQSTPYISDVANKALDFCSEGFLYKSEFIRNNFQADLLVVEPETLRIPLISFMFLLLGLLLPDIDMPNSTLGKHFYLPIEHRTWTHTVWFMALFGIIGYFFHPIMWVAIGIFLHLFCDSFSRCGVCWLYPITKYRHYGNAKIKNNHFLYFYQGDISSWVTTVVVVIICCYFIFNHFEIYM